MSIEFESLPGAAHQYRTRNTKHADVAAALRERPGEWARVSVHSTRGSAASMAHFVRRGSLPAYTPAGTFEAASRTVDGEFRVYARYVGEASS